MAAAGGHSEICGLLLIHRSPAANKVGVGAQGVLLEANRLGATALHMAAKGRD